MASPSSSPSSRAAPGGGGAGGGRRDEHDVSRLSKSQALAELSHNLNVMSAMEARNHLLMDHLAKLDEEAGTTGAAKTARTNFSSSYPRESDPVDVEAARAGPPGSHEYVVARAKVFGEKTRYLIRLENALHRFHHHFDAAKWEVLTTDELDAALEKAELLADMAEHEKWRQEVYPDTEAFYDSLPSLDADLDTIRAEHEKVNDLATLYRLVQHPKVARLREEAVKVTKAMSAHDINEQVAKARLLKDIRTHLTDLRLLGKEKGFDLTTPLEDIRALWMETNEDHRLLRSFAKCSICSKRHAPRAILKKHPHLNLLPTGTTHFGGKNCCVNCAPYWD